MAFEAIIVVASIIVFALVLLIGKDLIVKRLEKSQKTDPKDTPHRLPDMSLLLGPRNSPLQFDRDADAEPGANDELYKLMQENTEQLNKFYGLAGYEQKNAFTSALIVSFLGFGLLASGVILSLVHSGDNFALYTTVGGAIVELISGLFFWIYNKCAKQFDDLYKSLMQTQKILMSIHLAEMTGGEKKYDIYKYIVECIMKQDVTASKDNSTGTT